MGMTEWADTRAGTLTDLEGIARHAVGGSTAVGKALGLLDALGTGRPAQSLSVLAARTGMPKSTAYRILQLMEALGFVGRQDLLYCLGPRVRELGRRATLSTYSRLRTASLGVLERLHEEVRTTVHLAVLTGSEVLCLEKITAPGGSRIPTQVGLTVPALCTALGKAQLAYADRASVAAVLRATVSALTQQPVRSPQELFEELATIRMTGLAIDREEFRPGISCVAAPIIVGDRTVAAISASSVHAPAYTAQRMTFVRDAARRLSGQLERLGTMSS
jgi:DNA-binding IclR family transcriptional regulator